MCLTHGFLSYNSLQEVATVKEPKKKKNVINANFNIELADIQTAQENYKNKFSIPGVVEVEFTVRCDLHGQVPLTSAARPVRFFSFVSNVSMATESHKK